jgi:hypothetical protein
MSAFQKVMDCQDLRRFIREYVPPHPIAIMLDCEYGKILKRIQKNDDFTLFELVHFKNYKCICRQCKKTVFQELQDWEFEFCSDECEDKYEEECYRCDRCDMTFEYGGECFKTAFITMDETYCKVCKDRLDELTHFKK